MTTWYAKLLFAGMGAVCLSLLKLIGANFYLGAASRDAVIGAYLTYVCYLILGMAVGYFFGEERPESLHKTRQSVFLMGLLAPSILLAVINKSNLTIGVPTSDANSVPTLGLNLSPWPVSTVHAQSSKPGSPAIAVVTKKDFSPSFFDGVSAALGLAQPPEPKLLWIAGKTADEKKALQTAQQLDAWLPKQGNSTKALKAKIIKPENSSEFYVTVEHIDSSDGTLSAAAGKTAWQIDRTLKDAATKTLSAGGDESTARIVINGDVVKGDSLFKH